MPNIKEFYMGIDGECTIEYDNDQIEKFKISDVNPSSQISQSVLKALKYDMPVWRKAIARSRAGISPALLAFYGDSKTAGQGAGTGTSNVTSARKRSEAFQVVNILNRKLCKATTDSWMGDQNIGAVAGYTGQPTAGVGYNLYDPTVVASGGSAWNSDTGVSPAGGRFWIGQSGGTGSLTFTPSSNFDTVVVVYARVSNSASSLPVTINGVSQTAINTQGANLFGSTTFTGVATGNIVLGAPTGGNAFLIGVYCYLSSDPGIIPLQFGACGQTTAWMSGGNNPWEQANCVQSMSPHLTVFKSLTNDVNSGVTAASYSASLQTLITKIKSVGDLVVVIDTPGSSTGFTNGLYEAYISQINTICSASNINVIDLRSATATTYSEGNSAGYTYDSVSHLNSLGYAACAELIANVVASV